MIQIKNNLIYWGCNKDSNHKIYICPCYYFPRNFKEELYQSGYKEKKSRSILYSQMNCKERNRNIYTN